MGKTIRVAAGVILQDGKIFAAQRGYGTFKDGWEFPGGKIEPGETPEAALKRELREELAVSIDIDAFLCEVKTDLPDGRLVMDCFLCHLTKSAPRLLEHEAARWLAPSELDSVHWLKADRTVVERVKERFSNLCSHDG